MWNVRRLLEILTAVSGGKRRISVDSCSLERIIAAQEAERKRIARELHDRTGQALVTLKLGLRAIREAHDMEEVRRTSHEMGGLVDQAISEVRDLSVQLRPSALDDHGIEAALAGYVRRSVSLAESEVTFSSRGINGRRLPPAVETAVYRIVQEAVLNAVKHAGAKRIAIFLEKKGSTLTATVEDDGCGFDLQELEQSPVEEKLGIFGMRERASLVEGRLSIRSSPGKGTTVFLAVPLQRTG